MDCSILEEPGNQLSLRLEGDLTIQNARDLRDVILQAQASGRDLNLNLERVTGADVSCLQLFCSAHRTLVKSDRHLTLVSPLPETFVHIVRQAGFSRDRGCALDVQNTCLWRTGGNP